MTSRHMPVLGSMRNATRLRRSLAILLWLAAALGCCKNEGSAEPAAQRTQGGESALDRAGHEIDEAHARLKREVRPAAEVVDEKPNAAVNEGRKAVNKIVGAVDGSTTDSAQPKAEPKAGSKRGHK